MVPKDSNWWQTTCSTANCSYSMCDTLAIKETSSHRNYKRFVHSFRRQFGQLQYSPAQGHRFISRQPANDLDITSRPQLGSLLKPGSNRAYIMHPLNGWVEFGQGILLFEIYYKFKLYFNYGKQPCSLSKLRPVLILCLIFVPSEYCPSGGTAFQRSSVHASRPAIPGSILASDCW